LKNLFKLNIITIIKWLSAISRTFCIMKRFFLLALFVLGVKSAVVSQNVTYSPLYSSSAFDDKNIVTSLPVGSTPGAGSVSNGTAVYSIPIATPPGTNGVVPKVSIDYNSQGQGGIAGMGWNITGLSAITSVILPKIEAIG
jgi:hypothetical protein